MIKKILIAIVSSIGMIIMAYLTYIHYANARSFCDISETVSCDTVTTSVYSEIFGIPISVMGFLYFLTVLAITVFVKNKNVFKLILYTTILMLVPSLYFSLVELFFIKAVCLLCETSKALMAGILIVSFLGTRTPQKVVLKEVIFLILTGIILTAVIFFMQTGNNIKRDYTKFAQCLNDKGVVYYKSVKCNNCKRQEKLFGKAYSRLNSVECHPEGSNANPALCLSRKISKTPTFAIEKEGVEQKRAEGLQPLDKLASFSGCSLE